MTIIRQRFGRGNAVDPVVWRAGSWRDPVSNRREAPAGPFGGDVSLQTNLLAYYAMEDNAANGVVTDSTPAANHGTYTVNTNTVHFTPAKHNDGFDCGLNPNQQVDVTCLEAAPGDYFHKDKPFSMSCWIRLDSSVPSASIVLFTNFKLYLGSTHGFLMGLDTSNRPEFRIYDLGTTCFWTAYLPGALSPDIWYMLTYTYDGSNTLAGMTLYRNASAGGITRSGSNFPGRVETDQIRLFGVPGGGSAWSRQGDEMGIWAKELPAGTDVVNLYAAGAGLYYDS